MSGMRAVLMTAAVLSAMVGTGCNRSVVAVATSVGFGQECNEETPCVEPLVCTDGTCAPGGAAEIGDACIVNADCITGARCADEVCVAGGTLAAGEPCSSNADCDPTLRCAPTPVGVPACSDAGEGYLDDPCSVAAECMAGLFCADGRCAPKLAEPVGTVCTSDFDCVVESGIYCQDGVCAGLGVDGEPLQPWAGVSCPPINSLDGDFRVHFELGADEDFFKLPHPTDARRTTRGVDLSGFPIPPETVAAGPIVQRLVEASQTDPLGYAEGFGSQETVFMRFSGPPLFCGSGCGEASPPASEPGCMGGAEPEPTVFVVDVTDEGGGTFPGFSTGLSFSWRASTGSSPYICGPWIGIRPGFDSSVPSLDSAWLPGHSYAVFVHSRAKGCDGETRVDSKVDRTLSAMLSTSAPADSALQSAYDAHAPLRAWLATSPTYPAGGTVVAADILGAAVFTVRDSADTAIRLATEASAAAAPTVASIQPCDGSPAAPASCSAFASFTEYQGQLEIPLFQNGDAPFLVAGGALNLDGGGVLRASGSATLSFALTVPSAAPPANGWPVLIYAHGTGGNERSHIESGLAGALTSIDRGGSGIERFAVLGIEQVAHGSRRGTSILSPDLLFFNIANPAASRGNVLQAALDQIALARSIASLSTAVQGEGGAALDATTVALLGHSQGGQAAAIAAAASESFEIVALSGAGASLLSTLGAKTAPYDVPQLLRGALSDPDLGPLEFHPVLSLLQGYFADADPHSIARRYAAEIGTGRSGTHVLHFIGVGDSYTPNDAGLKLARQLRGIYANSDGSGLPAATEIVAAPGDYPLSANLNGFSVVTSIHEAATGDDGHFVLFDENLDAMRRVGEFVGSWAAGETPQVVE